MGAAAEGAHARGCVPARAGVRVGVREVVPPAREVRVLARGRGRAPAPAPPGPARRRNPSGCCARSAEGSLCRWPVPVLIAFLAKQKRKRAGRRRAHGGHRPAGLPGRRMPE